MPTGRNSDVIPVRKATKQRLDELRGRQSYDAALRKLLGEPVESDAGSRPSPDRDPDEQLLIARLAAQRWRLWAEQGRVKWLGPRLVEYWPSEPQREVSYVVARRRGFAP